MTLDGTNTYLLSEPLVARGRRRPRARTTPRTSTQSPPPCRRADGAVVLLTHGHADHSEGAGRFAGGWAALSVRSTRTTARV
jgi:phosphoribosyl 1,2-cyclic phosphodiesterase